MKSGRLKGRRSPLTLIAFGIATVIFFKDPAVATLTRIDLSFGSNSGTLLKFGKGVYLRRSPTWEGIVADMSFVDHIYMGHRR
ncbi:hypothetical protein SLEP1_g30618 [Rubroshorea leprosula]|uniref:Uncharacterized protein n=1 Tax=Rubroshorea leprosula TaxID=152421 RepID=A0AAV5K0P0_9ROSI|nr:hypothetical protein SLEP1_g30618 [Rubroshorea leprosula]